MKQNKDNYIEVVSPSTEIDSDALFVADRDYATCIPIKSPTRIDFMSEESFDNFMNLIKSLSEKFNATIEFPLFSARNRGVYRVVFLDKHLIGLSNEIQRFQV